MEVGTHTVVRGCFTKDKFIAGRTLAEIERMLGFHAGRLSGGMTVVGLLRLPQLNEFDLAAYSNVPLHRRVIPEGVDIEKVKKQARDSWQTSGFERIVKVLPFTPHSTAMLPDSQYPPALGAPQWVATVAIPARVIAVVTGGPDTRYRPTA